MPGLGLASSRATNQDYHAHAPELHAIPNIHPYVALPDLCIPNARQCARSPVQNKQPQIAQMINNDFVTS